MITTEYLILFSFLHDNAKDAERERGNTCVCVISKVQKDAVDRLYMYMIMRCVCGYTKLDIVCVYVYKCVCVRTGVETKERGKKR